MLRMGLSQNHNQHNHSSESVPLLLDLLHIVCACMLSCFSRVWLFATPWTVAQQAPLSMGFSREEYWNGLPVPSPGDLPHSGIKLGSPTLKAFLIWICSSFKAWMALSLSRRACFVKLVKASTLIIISVVPIEGTNKAAIYSYHWNTDLPT